MSTLLCPTIAASGFAQSASVGVLMQRWTLQTPVGDSLKLKSAQQTVVPLTFESGIGRRWRVNAAGAWTDGSATFQSAANAETRRDLSGPTDIRVRAAGSFRNDALSVAVGVNLPTGRTSLDNTELQALRILAAPASGMPAPVLGSGLGATVGVIAARTIQGWAIAAGITYEQRSSYDATEQLSAGLPAATRIKPGAGMHASLGATGAAGKGEMSFYGTADVFGTDALRVDIAPSPLETRYRLGPVFDVSWSYNPGVRRVPDLLVVAAVRVRTDFTDDVRGNVPGSGGVMSSGGVSATVVRVKDWRIREQLNARTFGGLAVDSSFVTAKFHEVGLTTVVNIPIGRNSIEPFVRLAVGSVNPGAASSGTRTVVIGGRALLR